VSVRRVGVVFGGPSREFGVSFLSARCLLENLPKVSWEAVPLFVGKDGLWHGPAAARAEMDRYVARPPREALLDGIVAGTSPAPFEDAVVSFTAAMREARPEVLFPINHGTFGEDGAHQGLYESFGIPYVGFGVAASAVGMDKILMKAAFAAAGLQQVEYLPFSRADWESHGRRHLLEERLQMLHLPLFVKPSCAGSSVGITKVKHERDLPKAVEVALEVDQRVLVEEGVDAREIECSVLEGEDGRPTEASLPGEIIPGHEFYDYEDKYIDDRSRSAGSGRPVASHIFGNIEIGVKPGSEFSSFRRIRFVPRSTKKSTRANPAPPSVSNAAIASIRISSTISSGSSAGITLFDRSSMYLSS